jgi:GDPmannose 4,6-dehydratase
MPQKTALVTGALGQDGTYLSEYLVGKGYRVIGTTRDKRPISIQSIGESQIEIATLDVSSQSAVAEILDLYHPNEIYHLAARASSADLNSDPEQTLVINGMSVLYFLESIRRFAPEMKFCHACSSEIFAGSDITPQLEITQFRPLNIYGVAKALSANLIRTYRSAFGLYACSAILYNHESPIRRQNFITRKVSLGVASIYLGQADRLVVGNLDDTRDWGYALDSMKAMHMMLQHEEADDYVVATGVSHSVRQLCEIAFKRVGLDYRKYVVVDPTFARRIDAVELRGDPRKVMNVLGWKPSVSFEELVHMMVDADIERLRISI